jgi:CubicO group peptidase (beta-lactamase class C family)
MTAVLLTNELAKRNLTIEEPISRFLNIPGGWLNTEGLEGYDSTDLYDYLSTYNLSYKPGTTYRYSNTGFGLAGIILERLSGKNYEQNLIDEMCTPLGLTTTRISSEGIDNHATGYNSQKTEIPYLDKIDAMKGSVSVRSSVKDLIAYGRSQITLDSSLGDAMEICQQVSFENPKVGLDWEYVTINGSEVISHFGGVSSFNSAIFICKSRNIVFVLLSNTDMGDDGTQFINMANSLAGAVIR